MPARSRIERCHEIIGRMVCASRNQPVASPGPVKTSRTDPSYASLGAATLTQGGRYINFAGPGSWEGAAISVRGSCRSRRSGWGRYRELTSVGRLSANSRQSAPSTDRRIPVLPAPNSRTLMPNGIYAATCQFVRKRRGILG